MSNMYPTKTTTQKTRKMSNMYLTKNREDMQFLSLIRHPPCDSYSQDVFDTTMCKLTQIS
jgi:hypothetical protein